VSDPADDPATALVAAALTPSGPERIARAQAALGRSTPDELAFAGWRALLLLDDVVDGGDPVWGGRLAGLRRRSYAAAAVAGHHAGLISRVLRRAGTAHVVTGEWAVALRYPRRGDRPVHGVTVVTTGPLRRTMATLRAAGIAVERCGRHSSRGDLAGLTLLVHSGWPGARRLGVVADPAPPGDGAVPVATVADEVARIERPPPDPDGVARLLDLAVLAGTLPARLTRA